MYWTKESLKTEISAVNFRFVSRIFPSNLQGKGSGQVVNDRETATTSFPGKPWERGWPVKCKREHCRGEQPSQIMACASKRYALNIVFERERLQ